MEHVPPRPRSPAPSGGWLVIEVSRRAVLDGFKSKRTWLGTLNLLVSLSLGAVFAAASLLAFLAAAFTAWIVGVGVVVRAGAYRLTARFARIDQRRLTRLGATFGLVALPDPEPGASFRERQIVWGRAGWLWRLPVYQLVRLVVASALAFVAVAWWWAVVVCFVLAAGPGTSVLFLGWRVSTADPNPVQALLLVMAGLVGIAAWPALVRAMIELDGWLARAFLGPSRSGQLAAEVSRLGRARALAVESAEAERRRIERDLHDGLQPQLVTLALDLGLARSRLERDPASARSLLKRAHEEAKRASEDLRNLVRGIHPSVLDERGIDAALSALVAGCPVPVSVEINLPQPLDPVRESTAYYLIAEALTNITKHAHAKTASVVVDSGPDAVRILVIDDGRGGARLEPGGGLIGLAARLAAVDGTLRVSSPAGGPTLIQAVLPCGP